MHAPNHGCLVLVTLKSTNGFDVQEFEGYLMLSQPRTHKLDTGLVLVDAAGAFPVYIHDKIELV